MARRDRSPKPMLRPEGFAVSGETERMLEPEANPTSPTEVMKTGLTEEILDKAEDYVDNPPPVTPQSPVQKAIDKGLIGDADEDFKVKISKATPEGRKAIEGMASRVLGKEFNGDLDAFYYCTTFISDMLDSIGADPLDDKGNEYNRTRANAYMKYGTPVDIEDIQEGDIVIFDFPKLPNGRLTLDPTRGKRNGLGDHATFYAGDRLDVNKPGSNFIGVLGGEQGQDAAISMKAFDKSHILGIRRIQYDNIDYNFTKELAKVNPDFNKFIDEQAKQFDFNAFENQAYNPMQGNNRLTSGFDEGGFASKALDFITSPLTGDYRKERPTSVQMAELGLEASPVGTVGDIVEDPSLSNIAMSVAPDLLGLGPVKGVARTLIRKGADKVSDIIKTVDGDVYDYDDIVKLEDTVDDWAKGYLTNKQLKQKLAESGVKINNPRITKKMDPTDIEFNMPDGGSYKYGQIPTTPRPAKYDQEMISVFPKPERMFPEDARPKGGDYLNPATGEVISGRNVSAATLKISPDGKPSFKVSNDDVESVGSTGKGKTQIKTNLFKKKAGWKWTNAPEGMEDIATLISVENKGKHYYTIETDFSKGVNLKKYPNSKTEPRLRPTVVGEIELGPQVGTISVRGKEHPVYSRVRTFNEGGAVMQRQMEMAFMNDGGLTDDGLEVDPVSGNEIPNGSLAEEVRDDIPAQLSEGEYVVPADVVRFYGVKFFEDLRMEAKRGLAEMESNGRIGGEPVPEGGPQANEAPITDQEMSALRELAMEMNTGGMVPSVNPNMQPPPQAVGNTSIQQPQMMNKGGTVLGFDDGGDLSAVQSKPLTGGGLGFSLFGPYTNDGSLPTGFGDDVRDTPFQEGQVVELFKDNQVLSFVMMRDYQLYLDKIEEGWLTKEQKDAALLEQGPSVETDDTTTTSDETTDTTGSSNDKTDYRQFITKTGTTPPKNVADMTNDELKVALEGMNIVGRTGSTLAYTMGLPVGALVGSQLAANYNNMLEVARDRKLISDKEYEDKRKGSIFGGEKSLFDNLIDRSDQNEKLGTTNKKGKDFGDTWLGDLLGFDGKAGVQGPGLKDSFGGARRDQTAVIPSIQDTSAADNQTAAEEAMGRTTSSTPKTQAEKTAAAKSATDDWVSATQAVQSTSTDDPKAWSDAIKAQSEASKAATKAIQEASGWSGGFFGSASNPDWRDAAAEGGLMSNKKKK